MMTPLDWDGSDLLDQKFFCILSSCAYAYACVHVCAQMCE